MSDRIDLGELERLYNKAAGGDYWPDEQAKAEVVTALPGLLAWVRDARQFIECADGCDHCNAYRVKLLARLEELR